MRSPYKIWDKLKEYKNSTKYVKYLKADIDYTKSVIKLVQLTSKQVVNCTHLVEMYMIEANLKALKSHLSRQEKILAKLE